MVAPPEAAQPVAILAVPLGPQAGKLTHLVSAFAHVPGLGDQFHLGNHGVLIDDVEEGGEAVDGVELARQGGGQVEAKPIHAHFLDPVAQAVHDELEHLWMAHVEGIAGAGEIPVKALILGNEAVIGSVIDALEAERRPQVVAFGGMVVDYVEDNFDAGAMQRLDHGLEFTDLLAVVAGGVARVGGEKVDGIVAPVIAQTQIDQALVVDEFMHRHQLHGGDAEFFEIFNGDGVRHAGVGAAQFGRDVRVQGGKALDMQLVDDGIVERGEGRPVVFPIEMGSGDDAFGHAPGIVVMIGGQIGSGAVRSIAEDRRVPVDGSGDRLGVRIEQ